MGRSDRTCSRAWSILADHARASAGRVIHRAGDPAFVDRARVVRSVPMATAIPDLDGTTPHAPRNAAARQARPFRLR